MLPETWKNRGALSGPNFDDFFDRFFYGWPTQNRDYSGGWSPRVDIHENDKEILLDVEVPGIDKKDIKVEVKNGTLTLSGERKDERKTDSSECCRSERYYGRFERSFSLPDIVETAKVSAEYKNGVLTLTLPKTEKAKPKEIQVAVK